MALNHWYLYYSYLFQCLKLNVGQFFKSRVFAFYIYIYVYIYIWFFKSTGISAVRGIANKLCKSFLYQISWSNYFLMPPYCWITNFKNVSVQVDLAYCPDNSLISTFRVSTRPSSENPAPECFILEIFPTLGILGIPLWKHFLLKPFYPIIFFKF